MKLTFKNLLIVMLPLLLAILFIAGLVFFPIIAVKVVCVIILILTALGIGVGLIFEGIELVKCIGDK